MTTSFENIQTNNDPFIQNIINLYLNDSYDDNYIISTIINSSYYLPSSDPKIINMNIVFVINILDKIIYQSLSNNHNHLIKRPDLLDLVYFIKFLEDCSTFQNLIKINYVIANINKPTDPKYQFMLCYCNSKLKIIIQNYIEYLADLLNNHSLITFEIKKHKHIVPITKFMTKMIFKPYMLFFLWFFMII
jgi:hypothetical protein